MGDELDGCECIWSHEMAMQRLINFIRQNQNACSDTTCIDVSGRVTGQAGADDSCGNSIRIAIAFLLLAIFMYIVNPSTWSRFTTNSKNSRRDNNPDGAPPPHQPRPAIN
ncbi:small integral membrane protein 14 [Drosophila grimshawi]|uniref:Small integral membrane protein 14 n=1 Tax=Drosophila grimshawi TaxID=7222 RepID=B4J822_DROGR|nr:small integral membrane protein 14 [Drosophila grimshawi]XP_032591559.1 small integral membrane protein 14 [Drosophila grimshawi]XP_032591560.1 small integral membrane protein 14 [Drosophila grimshawi]EDW02252.1 GH19998 [Drosophila grimshawi]